MKQNKTMKYLFLDDERMPHDVGNYTDVRLRPMYRLNGWAIVRSYDQFVDWITKNGLPDVISFDHDLSDERFKEKTGYDCAKWLVEYCNGELLPECYCHSMNPVGKQNIVNYLVNYQKQFLKP